MTYTQELKRYKDVCRALEITPPTPQNAKLRADLEELKTRLLGQMMRWEQFANLVPE
jgi:hypothetical protein